MVPGGVARQPKPEVIGTPLNGLRRPKADSGPGGAGTYAGGACPCARAAAAAASAMRRCSASQASRSFRSRSTISAATASCRALTCASWLWIPGLAACSSPLRRVVSAMSLSTWAFLASASSRAAFSRASAASALALRSLISASTACSRACEFTLVAFCWVSLSIAEFWLRKAWSARSMVSVRLPPLFDPKKSERFDGTPPDLYACVAICPISFLVSVIFCLSFSSCWVILALFCWARSTRAARASTSLTAPGARKLALVDHQVPGGLGDLRVHEFERLLHARGLGVEGRLLVFECVGEGH